MILNYLFSLKSSPKCFYKGETEGDWQPRVSGMMEKDCTDAATSQKVDYHQNLDKELILSESLWGEHSPLGIVAIELQFHKCRE